MSEELILPEKVIIFIRYIPFCLCIISILLNLRFVIISLKLKNFRSNINSTNLVIITGEIMTGLFLGVQFLFKHKINTCQIFYFFSTLGLNLQLLSYLCLSIIYIVNFIRQMKVNFFVLNSIILVFCIFFTVIQQQVQQNETIDLNTQYMINICFIRENTDLLLTIVLLAFIFMTVIILFFLMKYRNQYFNSRFLQHYTQQRIQPIEQKVKESLQIFNCFLLNTFSFFLATLTYRLYNQKEKLEENQKLKFYITRSICFNIIGIIYSICYFMRIKNISKDQIIISKNDPLQSPLLERDNKLISSTDSSYDQDLKIIEYSPNNSTLYIDFNALDIFTRIPRDKISEDKKDKILNYFNCSNIFQFCQAINYQHQNQNNLIIDDNNNKIILHFYSYGENVFNFINNNQQEILQTSEKTRESLSFKNNYEIMNKKIRDNKEENYKFKSHDNQFQIYVKKQVTKNILKFLQEYQKYLYRVDFESFLQNWVGLVCLSSEDLNYQRQLIIMSNNNNNNIYNSNNNNDKMMIKQIYHRNKVTIIKYKNDGSMLERTVQKRQEFKQHKLLQLQESQKILFSEQLSRELQFLSRFNVQDYKVEVQYFINDQENNAIQQLMNKQQDDVSYTRRISEFNMLQYKDSHNHLLFKKIHNRFYTIYHNYYVKFTIKNYINVLSDIHQLFEDEQSVYSRKMFEQLINDF